MNEMSRTGGWLPTVSSKRRKSGAGIVLVLAAGIGFATAETPGEMPAARELISRHLDAVGGFASISRQRSYHWSGRFEVPGQKTAGSLEIFGQQPHKLWLKVEIPNTAKYVRATDGQTMWRFNPQSGYRTREDWEFHAKQGLARSEDEAQRRLTEVLELFSTLRADDAERAAGVVARTSFDGHPCFELSSARRKNQVVREFFDASSGIRVGVTYPGTNTETFLLDAYEDFSGVKIPTRVTRLADGKTNDVFTIRAAEFVDVPDSRFAMPIHVPEWPEAWNEVTEAYPPGFAKETKPWPWKGEHSRWFHRGFGRTNDAFFWSYVVFNALEGDTLKSAADLQDALHRYDASLYGKAFAPEKIKVAIGAETIEDKSGHTVTRRSVIIDGFDAESSKKELRTNLETFRWYCPSVDRTAFLILRSPRPFKNDDEVWKALLWFRDRMVCHE